MDNLDNEEKVFKVKNPNKGSGIGKTIIVPFISGIVGASLIIGICFGVPSIKSSLLNFNSSNVYNPKVTQNSESTSSAISLSGLSDTAESVASKVLPTVVGITVKYDVNSIFGKSTAEASGSGIIISSDGYIVTNNHVISSDTSSNNYYQLTQATGITITLYDDKTEYPATVVGSDAETDLAVLKIDTTGLTPIQVGNSDNLKVGQYVLAIGNPLGMKSSVTGGIVSALNREVTTDDGTTYIAIQTDAAINSGNSGGALVNSQGELVGINTLKLGGSGIEGMGFAIPVNSAINIINQLIEFKTVKRPQIGIEGSTVTTQISKRYNIPEGVYVETILKGTGAEKAELKVGDIITKFEGVEIKTMQELNKEKNKKNIGDTVTLTIWTDNQEKEIKLTLGEEVEKETEATNKQTQQNNQSNNDYSGIPQTPGYSFYDFFGF